MKITVKPKVESMEQINVRVPASLKKQLESLRARAAELDTDYNGTLVGVLAEFAAELLKQFESRSKGSSRTGSKALAQNGSEQGGHRADG